MSFQQVLLSLKPSQKKNILDFASAHANKLPNFKGKQLLIRLARDQLEGNDRLLLPKSLASKVIKAKQEGKGCQIKLIENCMCKNRQGGALAALAPVGISVIGSVLGQSAKKAASSESAGDRRINKRLEHLRGNGIDTDSEAFRKGMMLAQQESQKGEGFFSSLVDGFTFGLKNPIQGVELLAREGARALDKATAPKKKKKGKGVGIPLSEKYNPPYSYSHAHGPNGGSLAFHYDLDNLDRPEYGMSSGSKDGGGMGIPTDLEKNFRGHSYSHTHGLGDSHSGAGQQKKNQKMQGRGIQFY